MYIRAFKIILIALLLLVLLLWGSFYAILKIPSVQTWVLHRATSYIESKYNVKANIEEADLYFPYYFTFKGVTVYDLKNDTLLYAAKVTAAYHLSNISKSNIDIPYIHLRNASFRLRRYADDDDLNLIKLIENFPTSSDTSSQQKVLSFEKIFLDNVHFSYIDDRYPGYSPVFDATHIDIKNLYGRISDIHFNQDTIMMDIHQLALKERSGFEVKKLNGKFALSNTGIGINRFSMETLLSNIKGTLSMKFDSWDDFSDFENNVKMHGEFENSFLSSNDISKFTTHLLHLEQRVEFSGLIKGTVNNLRGNFLDIKFGQSTHFKGSVSINDIMEIDNSFIDLNVSQLTTRANDLRKIQIAPYDQCTYLTVPEVIDNLGLIQFKGKFTGFIHDFVAYGNLTSALGLLSSDLNLKIDDQRKVSYSGKLVAQDFNMGKFLNSSTYLHRTSFNLNVEGKGVTLSTADLSLDGKVEFIELMNYPYSNIELDGIIKQKKFNGDISIYDPHFGMMFNGLIDFNSKIPMYDFTANIEYLRPVKTKLIDRHESAELNGRLHLIATGNSFNNFEGLLSIDSLNYAEDDKNLFINKILIEANESSITQNNFLSIRSDFLNARISGRSNAISFYNEFSDRLSTYYIPQFDKKKLKNDYAKAEVYLHEADKISEIFLPELKFAKDLQLQIELNKKDIPLNIQLVGDSIQFGAFYVNAFEYSLKSDSIRLQQAFYSSIMNVLDSLHFRDLRMESSTDNFNSTFNFSVDGLDSTQNQLRLLSRIDHKSNATQLMVDKIDLLLDQTRYNNRTSGLIALMKDSISLQDINIYSGIQSITVNGILSDRLDETLSIRFDSVQTTFFNKILAVYGLNTNGVVQGNIELQSLLKDFKFNADLDIYNFILNDEKIGNTHIHSRYSDESKVVFAEVKAELNKIKTLDIKGEVDLNNEKPELDFDLHVSKIPMATFNKYIVGFASELSGLCGGDLLVKGPLDKLILTGTLRLQKVRFRIDYLNTYYSFSDEVTFNERNIDLEEIDVYDMYGNKGKASGKIYHTHLDNFIFNINIDANNLNVLNTSKSQNDFFYGTAFASGNAYIYGALDFLRMRIGVRSEKNSEVNFSFSGSSEVTRNSYIRFVNNNYTDTLKQNLVANVETEGIDLAMDIEANENLKVRIVFDEAIGDIMEGRGTGDMRMEIDTKGDVKMFGSYFIDNGNYLFTLQNVINKKFDLDKGGSISWEGNPYEAKIDMTARYSVRAGLYDLLQDTATALKRRVPVEVALKLSDDLMTPDIKFGIRVPDLDPYTESLVTKYITTDEEINRQVFSLLFARKFSTPPELASSSTVSSQSNAAVENATEFLSNQLSNWVSNISDNIDVGFYYRSGDKISSEELEIALSTQLFNERVIVDGSFGVHNGLTSSANQLIGDFNILYKISEDGKFRLKAFNRYNENSLYKYYSSPYTQGVGVTYTDEFNTIRELLQRYFSKPKETQMESSAR